jgi:putative flippase GtrA
MRKRITAFIDFFHLPLFQFIPQETFRYLFCGVSTLVVDWVVYSFALHFIFDKQAITVPFIGLVTASNAAKTMAIVCGFIWGFGMNKYIVFTNSTLKGRQQLPRYTLIVLTCVVLNYFILNLLLTQFPDSFTLSNIITSLLVAVYSYIVQRTFTFKVTKK